MSTGDTRHDPTPSRLAAAKRQGNVAKSRELATAFSLTCWLLLAYLGAKPLANRIRLLTTQLWSGDQVSVSMEMTDGVSLLQNLAWSILAILAPVLGFAFLIGWSSNWVQTGPIFVPQKASPQLSNLGWGSWFQRTLSGGSMMQWLFGFPRLIAALTIAGYAAYQNRMAILMLPSNRIDQILIQIGSITLSVLSHVAVILAVVAGLDFLVQVKNRKKRLRMSDQELRDELRAESGNPATAQQNRQLPRI
ncbi:MAG: EscU/YscU/HrcU family type III secretion system export apparatus switch protein [Planctomycetota bacterium]